MENEFEKNTERIHTGKTHERVNLREDEVTRLVATMLEEIKWFAKLVDQRIAEIEDPLVTPLVFSQYALPVLHDHDNPYAQLVKQFSLGGAERLLLVCSLIQYVSPELLTQKLRDDENHVRLKYAEFGGYIDRAFTHFVPSLQTVLFLLAGNDKTNAAFYKLAIHKHGKLISEGVIRFNPMSMAGNDDNEMQHIPQLAQEYLYYFQAGVKPRPDFGRAFPATWVTTGLDWEHLVLSEKSKKQVKEVMRWVEFGDELTGSSSMFNTSYPCLFYGPPGTGKSLTAKLIGKKYSKDVFRVDLSMVVSKYVGETEKNLAHLFDRAHGKNWILFFDEADSLFSKRTEVGNANDKWANLEVSYLLQRMEEHKGLTILATNLKDNLDGAMTRRFQSIIYFPFPSKTEREILWKSLLPSPFTYSSDINIEKLAAFELTGANIANIIKDSCLCALDHKTKTLDALWLSDSIKKEFIKEKRTP
ncbi:MAG TPA: ATP-binding protein [Flavobacteriales bacterium]|nr:ATP-binding protein [Flavobacteriales bacterium]